MAKLIAIREEVYMKLRKLKGKQSFSAAIDSLIESKSGDISRYFGVWRNKKDLDKVEAEISASRKSFGVRRKSALAGV